MQLPWQIVHSQRKSFYKKAKIKVPKNLKMCKELDSYKCRVCGSSDNVGAHHIINRSLGGDNALSNLITLCFKCHRQIHDGTRDFRHFLNRLNESHPRPEWFRWGEALEELNRRK